MTEVTSSAGWKPPVKPSNLRPQDLEWHELGYLLQFHNSLSFQVLFITEGCASKGAGIQITYGGNETTGGAVSAQITAQAHQSC